MPAPIHRPMLPKLPKKIPVGMRVTIPHKNMTMERMRHKYLSGLVDFETKNRLHVRIEQVLHS